MILLCPFVFHGSCTDIVFWCVRCVTCGKKSWYRFGFYETEREYLAHIKNDVTVKCKCGAEGRVEVSR